MTQEELLRFLKCVIVLRDDQCWPWLGYKTQDGYGQFCIHGKMKRAHRLAYEHFRQELIPTGMQLDHLCRNRGCVNPWHTEIVTNRENAARGVSFSALNMKKTHCPKGHPYSGENLIIRKKNWRDCRICKNARWVAMHRRKMANKGAA